MYTHEEVRAIIKFVLEEERRLSASEISGAALKQHKPEQTEPIKVDMPEVTAEEEKEVPPGAASKPKSVKNTSSKPKSSAPKRQPIDHGKIMALHKGRWPVAKIADEMGCSEQTVRNHIAMEEKKDGIG